MLLLVHLTRAATPNMVLYIFANCEPPLTVPPLAITIVPPLAIAKVSSAS